MMDGKTFHLGHLITVATGTIVRPDFRGFQELLERLAGGPVWSHQLADAVDALSPCLLGQHPWLADIHLPKFPDQDVREAVEVWLAEQVAKYGEQHEVTSCETAARGTRSRTTGCDERPATSEPLQPTRRPLPPR